MAWIMMGEEIQISEGPSRDTSVAFCCFIFSPSCGSEEQEGVLGEQVLLRALPQACFLMALGCAQPGWCWRFKPAKFREFQTQLSLVFGWTPHTRATLTSCSWAVPWHCGSTPNALPREDLGINSHSGYLNGEKNAFLRKMLQVENAFPSCSAIQWENDLPELSILQEWAQCSSHAPTSSSLTPLSGWQHSRIKFSAL